MAGRSRNTTTRSGLMRGGWVLSVTAYIGLRGGAKNRGDNILISACLLVSGDGLDEGIWMGEVLHLEREEPRSAPPRAPLKNHRVNLAAPPRTRSAPPSSRHAHTVSDLLARTTMNRAAKALWPMLWVQPPAQWIQSPVEIEVDGSDGEKKESHQREMVEMTFLFLIFFVL